MAKDKEMETPFSITKEEYEDFTKKSKGFSNERLEEEPFLFQAMLDDLPRFVKSKNGKVLTAALSDLKV